jgi:hypothetical protein
MIVKIPSSIGSLRGFLYACEERISVPSGGKAGCTSGLWINVMNTTIYSLGKKTVLSAKTSNQDFRFNLRNVYLQILEEQLK